MKKNIFNYIYLAIVIAIATFSYFIFYQTKSINANTDKKDIKIKNTFTADNVNEMKVDTFTLLVQKAYGNLATITTTNELVSINMNEANLLTKDFFNGNDALLKCNIKENRFVIIYNATDKSLVANFSIKNKGVMVPNDVLIKITDKIYNAKKSKAINDK